MPFVVQTSRGHAIVLVLLIVMTLFVAVGGVTLYFVAVKENGPFKEPTNAGLQLALRILIPIASAVSFVLIGFLIRLFRHMGPSYTLTANDEGIVLQCGENEIGNIPFANLQQVKFIRRDNKLRTIVDVALVITDPRRQDTYWPKNLLTDGGKEAWLHLDWDRITMKDLGESLREYEAQYLERHEQPHPTKVKQIVEKNPFDFK